MRLLQAIGLVCLLALPVSAQEARREELRRVPAPGSDAHEVVTNRLVVPPGATLPLHSHPGDEHAVVITEARARTPSGQEVGFAAGTPLYFPEGEVHGGLTNIGESDMVAITVTILRKGAPFSSPAD